MLRIASLSEAPPACNRRDTAAARDGLTSHSSACECRLDSPAGGEKTHPDREALGRSLRSDAVARLRCPRVGQVAQASSGDAVGNVAGDHRLDLPAGGEHRAERHQVGSGHRGLAVCRRGGAGHDASPGCAGLGRALGREGSRSSTRINSPPLRTLRHASAEPGDGSCPHAP